MIGEARAAAAAGVGTLFKTPVALARIEVSVDVPETTSVSTSFTIEDNAFSADTISPCKAHVVGVELGAELEPEALAVLEALKTLDDADG